MRTMGILLAVLAGVVASVSSANAASFSACQSIADPMQRLACYDKAAKAPAPSGKTAAVASVPGAAFNAAPTKAIPVKVGPVESGPRYWIEAEGGIYGFSQNHPVLAAIAAPQSGVTTAVPTAPGFIGLFSISTVTNQLATATTPDFGGGGSLRMGYWLDPARTMAVDGSVFYVRGKSRFDLSATPTTVTTTQFINTTPDVFVGLFNDTTTTTLSNGAISEQLYGADTNFRTKLPQFAAFSNFDVMVGVRYAALDENLTANVSSSFTRAYQPSLGLPFDANFSNAVSGLDSFRIRNDFIGPQVGFNAEQHWGPYWVASENKLAVGATFERLSVNGVNVFGTTPTTTFFLAGIPLQRNTFGTPTTGLSVNPPFGLFGQGNRDKLAFAVVPSGDIKFGYDINQMLSVTLAYNYLYMSSVGRIADQIGAPTDIKQSSFFAQGLTLGAKAKF